MTKSADQAAATVLDGDWLTLAEAVRTLGKSQSTIERLVSTEALRSKQRPRPGRKPERLYSAEDVRRLAGDRKTSSRSIALVARPKQLAIPPEAISSLRDVMTEWAQSRDKIAIREKLWLTLDEAAAYSGLPKAVLQRAVTNEEIVAIKAGAWRVRRASLEEYSG